jgi:hypothetical protein
LSAAAVFPLSAAAVTAREAEGALAEAPWRTVAAGIGPGGAPAMMWLN